MEALAKEEYMKQKGLNLYLTGILILGVMLAAGGCKTNDDIDTDGPLRSRIQRAVGRTTSTIAGLAGPIVDTVSGLVATVLQEGDLLNLRLLIMKTPVGGVFPLRWQQGKAQMLKQGSWMATAIHKNILIFLPSRFRPKVRLRGVRGRVPLILRLRVLGRAVPCIIR